MNPSVFHITHFDNLSSIIQGGGLWSDTQRINQNLNHTNIGYNHIKSRRLNHPVLVAGGGMIGQYVPFNFCPRSVMLYVVGQGHSEYNNGQTEVIHLVTDVNNVRHYNRYCFFTDIHADLYYSQQFDDFNCLSELNWSAIQSRDWRDSQIKVCKQAEFLAMNHVPWHAITEIGVINQDVANRVIYLISHFEHQPLVKVKPQWYY